MSALNSLQVAQAFLDLANEETLFLDNIKVQQLVMNAYGIHLAVTGTSIINEDVYAWDFGPVIKSLYNRLQAVGNGLVLDSLVDKQDKLDLDQNTPAVVTILSVWNACKNHDGRTLLSYLTVNGSAWAQCWYKRKYETIPDDLIRVSFLDRLK